MEVKAIGIQVNCYELTLTLHCPKVVSGEPQQVVFTIPIFEPMPSQYYIRAVSDRWLGSEAVCVINFQHLILPEKHPPHTGTHSYTNTCMHFQSVHMPTVSPSYVCVLQNCWTYSRCQ